MNDDGDDDERPVKAALPGIVQRSDLLPALPRLRFREFLSLMATCRWS